MSNSDALATVTATLQHLLSGVAPAVTTQPPSAARSNQVGNQLNIFLYSLQPNSAFSNFPMPGAARSGENAHPPLPLVLHYLLTAYGSEDDDIAAQRVLGQAMSILHDHPLLSGADIEGIVPDSSLQDQVERVRITPQTLSLDDMSKLWTSFQSAEYRLSVAYQVSVVLIESTRPNTAPLPVLRRGEQDRGANVKTGSLPLLTGLRFPNQKPGAELGDTVTLLGERLSGDNLIVRFHHPFLVDSAAPPMPVPIDLVPEANSTASELQVRLPNQADDVDIGSKWPAGFYSLSLVSQPPGQPELSSNALSIPLAPQIVSVDPDNAPAGNIVLTVECLPQVRLEQKVLLLFGSQSITPDNVDTPADTALPTSLTFTVENAVAKATPYILRLRIDGVDSIPVDFSGTVPQFAANQQVTVT